MVIALSGLIRYKRRRLRWAMRLRKYPGKRDLARSFNTSATPTPTSAGRNPNVKFRMSIRTTGAITASAQT
jgi:hypothetical protein